MALCLGRFLSPASAADDFASNALLHDGLPPGAHILKIGDPAPEFSLLGIDGKTYTLADFKEAPLLMVAFLSNHCPVSHAIEPRLLPYVAEMRKKGLAVVAINPNAPEALRVEELGYSKYNDGYEEMKLYARDRGFKFPYLYDGDTQVTAMAYGCLATPEVFIFDRARRLRYKGRFDNSRLPDPASVTRRDAPDAIAALLAGRPVDVPVTLALGCSTKWKLKATDVAESEERWDREPVRVDPIDDAGVAALARNDSKRLRVINVWATWCVPCVEEFPGLVSLARRFSTRPFDLITISLDDPKEKAAVKRFLEKHHAAVPEPAMPAVTAQGRRTDSYYYTGTDTDGFGRALDPHWQGALPCTLVIAPGGQVLYRHSGALDLTAFRGFLVDTLGLYYDQARIHAVR